MWDYRSSMHGLIRLKIVGIDDKEGAQISVVTNKV